ASLIRDHKRCCDLRLSPLDCVCQHLPSGLHCLALSCRKVGQVCAFMIENYLTLGLDVKIETTHRDLRGVRYQRKAPTHAEGFKLHCGSQGPARADTPR